MRNSYYLMRHGESLANVADKIISLPENGVESYGLSELGHCQARESTLASGLTSATVVVTSDFLRARQTADNACAALGIAGFEIHPGLRERVFAELEGRSGQEYHRVWALDDHDHSHSSFGAESPVALVARLRAVLEELEQAHSGQTILLVSHGDPLRFLQLAVAGRPLTEHQQVRHFAPAEIRALDNLPHP